MKSSSFKIEGMSCSACANRVERVVKKMNGVEEASVNFATETLLVKFDDAKIDAPKIEEATKNALINTGKTIQIYHTSNLEDSVKLAKEKAQSGDIV